MSEQTKISTFNQASFKNGTVAIFFDNHEKVRDVWAFEQDPEAAISDLKNGSYDSPSDVPFDELERVLIYKCFLDWDNNPIINDKGVIVENYDGQYMVYYKFLISELRFDDEIELRSNMI